MLFKIYYVLTYPLTLVALALLALYRGVLTFSKGKSCKFTPTCSKYAWDSVKEFGAIWGGVLAFRRLIRCRPNNPAGIDMPKLNLYRNYKWKC